MRNNIVSRALCAAALAGGAYLAYRAVRSQPRYAFQGRTAIVTGGARGLGLEISRLLVDEGARVAICSRTPGDIARAVVELSGRGGDVIGMACDVGDLKQVERFVRRVHEQWGPIDVLINNAGVIQVGPLAAMTFGDFEQALKVHVWGPLHCIHQTLPLLRSDGEGRIVNIASIGGKISVPHLLPYCASKFALVGLSQGLRAELLRKGVYVTTVCPGLMRTGSPRNALFKGEHRAEYAWFSIGGSLPGLSVSSSRAASQIVEACRRGDAEVVPGAAARAAILFHSLFPSFSAGLLGLTKSLLPAAPADGTETHLGKESFSNWSPSILTELNERAAAANNELQEDHDPHAAAPAG
jgi:NAD(P)-dependent dehydrogenase (short-subunit alcohol dehydrogenase family)